MRIGIIVHSKTGNTYSVAQKLEEKLAKAGHIVKLEKVEASDDMAVTTNVRLTQKPNIDYYDALIFGAPVRGFCLSPVMEVYLSQLSLKQKKVCLFVTHSFSPKWMGGTGAIKTMKKICEGRTGKVAGTWILNKKELSQASIVDETVNNMVNALINN